MNTNNFGSQIRDLRNGLSLSQTKFAHMYQIPIGTLRDWEQDRAVPPSYVEALCLIISNDPEGTASMIEVGAWSEVHPFNFDTYGI